MSNIYPIGQTREYLIARAARNRRSGKYEQAMQLLLRARAQEPPDEEVEAEIAAVYDEIGCEEAAMRAYLRVARMGGKHCADALFKLAVSSAQHGDLRRAESYFRAFCRSDRAGVSAEMVQIFQRQLGDALLGKQRRGKKSRAKRFENRAVQQLHAGKLHAAKRNVEHAIRLEQTPSRHLLKACCHLVHGEANAAVEDALTAMRLKPVYVQALCLLVDAYTMLERPAQARCALYRAARQARSTESLFNVAIESAKYGNDRLTLVLTKRILKREPYHVRAMAMRACAYMNLGSYRSAEKLFARLATLMPQDDVFSAYHALARTQKPCACRLTMAQDVTQDEAMDRGTALLSVISQDPQSLRRDEEAIARICRNAQWALYSAQTGESMTLMAVIVLCALDTPMTRDVLFDALLSPQLDDSLKQSILRAISEHCSEFPAYADLGGQFVRLAAGTAVSRSESPQRSQAVIQQAANALLRRYPDAAGELIAMWTGCVRKYGAVKKAQTDVCAAALEYAYHARHGRQVSMQVLCERYDVSRRRIRMWAKRILCALNDRVTFE